MRLGEQPDKAVIGLALRIFSIDRKLYLEARVLETGRSTDDDRWFIVQRDLPCRRLLAQSPDESMRYDAHLSL
jgi:hypothetical protein